MLGTHKKGPQAARVSSVCETATRPGHPRAGGIAIANLVFLIAAAYLFQSRDRFWPWTGGAQAYPVVPALQIPQDCCPVNYLLTGST
jgi:hypothetical protein